MSMDFQMCFNSDCMFQLSECLLEIKVRNESHIVLSSIFLMMNQSNNISLNMVLTWILWQSNKHSFSNLSKSKQNTYFAVCNSLCWLQAKRDRCS